MSAFTTVRIPLEAKARLDALQAHLAGRLGTRVSQAQATVAAIDMLHKLQLDDDLAITSRKQLANLARKIADDCNRRNAAAVCGAVRELTGIEPEMEVSADGKTYTIRADGKAVILADSVLDLAGHVAPLN